MTLMNLAHGSTLDLSQELIHLLCLHTWQNPGGEQSTARSLSRAPCLHTSSKGYREAPSKCPQMTGCHPAWNWNPVTVCARGTERLWLQPASSSQDELQLVPEVQRCPVESYLNAVFTNTFLNEARVEICQGWMADGDSTALGSNVCPSILPLSCCQSWLGDTAREDFILCVSIRLTRENPAQLPSLPGTGQIPPTKRGWLLEG